MKTELTKISTSELSHQFQDEIDVFICSSSYESRCRTIPESINNSLIKKAFICFNEDLEDYVGENKNILLGLFKERSRPVNLHTQKPLQIADNLIKVLDERAKESLTFLIDVTTFTHEALLILLNLLKLKLTSKDKLIFSYSSAEKYGPWLSKGIRDVRSVLGFAGEIMPSRRIHLIVLLGFEPERAKMLIDDYEPYRISIGLVPERFSTHPEHYRRNIEFWKELSRTYESAVQFEFSGVDAMSAKKDIVQQITRVAKEEEKELNVVIAPMNTKISTIGSGLLGLENTTIQICYASANIYNFKDYSEPANDCYFFELPNFLPTA